MAKISKPKPKRRPKERSGIARMNFREDPARALLEPGVAGIADLGATGGVGLPELALPEEMEMDDMERRELLVNPSDLQDPGDPESGDVGVVGGIAAGGELPDLLPLELWGSGVRIDRRGLGGTGTLEAEMAQEEEDRSEFEEEKL